MNTFTQAEQRFLMSAHPEVRLNKLKTVDELIEMRCPPDYAERIVTRELEKRARQLGPKFIAYRAFKAKQAAISAASASPDADVSLIDKIDQSFVF